MEYFCVLSTIGIVWFLLLRFRIPLSLLHLMLVYWSAQSFAVFMNGIESSNFVPTTIILSGMISWVVGLYLYPVVPHTFSRKHCFLLVSRNPSQDLRFMELFFLMLCAVVTYHYIVGGIPLLADAIKRTAFELTRSGMYGIPGRIAKVGPIFLIFLMTAYSQLIYNRRKRLLYFIVSVYLFAAVTYILEGHRGSILRIIQAIIIANPYYPVWRKNARINIKKLFYVGTVVSASVLVLGYNLTGETSVELYLSIINRIIYISGRSFYFLANEFGDNLGFGYGSYLWNDIKFVLGRVNILPMEGYTTTQLISSLIHGRDLASDFVVPTTITVFGDLYVNFGTLGVVIGGVLFGLACKYVHVKTRQSDTTIKRALLLMLQMILFTISTKGNAIYSTSSMVFGLFFCIIMLYSLDFLINLSMGTKPWKTVKFRVNIPSIHAI